MASAKVSVVCCLLVLSCLIDSTRSASCCLNYIKRRVGCARLLGYTIQTINKSCDINAVIFHLQGRFLCADPTKVWTRQVMRCLDERKPAE